MFEAALALGSAIVGAAATFAFRRWQSERERRELLLKRYLAQLQDACESLWFRIENLAYKGASGASSREYLATTTMYTLGRALGVERMLALEGLYPEIRRRFPKLKHALTPRVVDDAVRETTKAVGEELQHYDRLALGEATVERDGENFHQVTFLEFRRRVEGEDSEKRWWDPARESVAELRKIKKAEQEQCPHIQKEAKQLMCATKRLAVALSEVTEMDSPLQEATARCCEDEATRCCKPGSESLRRRLSRFFVSEQSAWDPKVRVIRRDLR